MPETCTCGAQLPPDARFCHRCGKPQRDEPVIEAAAQQSSPPVAVPPVVAELPSANVNLHNPVALRIGLTMGGFASLLSGLPAMAAGIAGLVLWWVSAGFLSAYVYRRKTGQFLTVQGGWRMGGITGLMSSVITFVFFTVSMVVATRSGDLATLYKDQLGKMYPGDPNIEQAIKVLQSPSGAAMLVFVALLLIFVGIPLLCRAGGALGAKMVGRG